VDKTQHRELEKQVKKDIKGHDKFVTAVDQAWGRVSQHRLLVVGAVALALLAGVGVSVASHFRENKENKAQSELFLAQHELTSAREKLTAMAQPPVPKEEKADAKKAKKADVKPPEPRVLTTAEKAAELKVSIEKFEEDRAFNRGFSRQRQGPSGWFSRRQRQLSRDFQGLSWS